MVLELLTDEDNSDGLLVDAASSDTDEAVEARSEEDNADGGAPMNWRRYETGEVLSEKEADSIITTLSISSEDVEV